jgi:hypothetical protein
LAIFAVLPLGEGRFVTLRSADRRRVTPRTARVRNGEVTVRTIVQPRGDVAV